MSYVVPPRFLFRYAFPVPRIDRLPKKGKRLLDLPQRCTLPYLDELDGAPRFAEVRVAWNARGLGLSATVRGKSKPPDGSIEPPAEAAGLQVWVGTRNTQSIHRAGRFCHHFCLLPAGGGRKGDEPVAVPQPIARAREESPLPRPDQIPIAVDRRTDGYRLEAWLPAATLYGYDPDANPRLGFYYCLRDAELGEQFLTVGREFPFAHDPSLWSTLELKA
jgi:hypothetical protein